MQIIPIIICTTLKAKKKHSLTKYYSKSGVILKSFFCITLITYLLSHVLKKNVFCQRFIHFSKKKTHCCGILSEETYGKI